jgi:hypothetical protein
MRTPFAIGFQKKFLGLLLSLVWAHFGNATEVQTDLCGSLGDAEGDVRILDATQTHLLDPIGHIGIPCRSWIATTQGWMKLRLTRGVWVHVGDSSFIEIDKILNLFKGQIYVDSSDDKNELQIETSSARIKIKKGQFIIVSSQEEESTQLIALSNSAIIENRFESSRQVLVNEGESSLLDFSLPRVVPHAPGAVSMGSIRPKFLDLKVPSDAKSKAVQHIVERQKKDFTPPVVQPATIAEKSNQNVEQERLPKRETDALLKMVKSDPKSDLDVKSAADKQHQKLSNQEEEKQQLIQEFSRVQK